jgi:hypothetical protein
MTFREALSQESNHEDLYRRMLLILRHLIMKPTRNPTTVDLVSSLKLSEWFISSRELCDTKPPHLPFVHQPYRPFLELQIQRWTVHQDC